MFLILYIAWTSTGWTIRWMRSSWGEDRVTIRWKDGEVSTAEMDFIERRYVPSAYADFYNDFLDRIRSGEKKNKYKNLMGLGKAMELPTEREAG